jgi:hypothetical protein
MHQPHESKYLKHIKKGNKVVCKVCNKEYSHSRDLKKHYVKYHNERELDEKQIPMETFHEATMRANTKNSMMRQSHFFTLMRRPGKQWKNLKISFLC